MDLHAKVSHPTFPRVQLRISYKLHRECINSSGRSERKIERTLAPDFFRASKGIFRFGGKRGLSFSFAKQVAEDNRRSSTCGRSTSTMLLSTGTNDIVQNDRCDRASRKAILPLYILGKTFMNILLQAHSSASRRTITSPGKDESEIFKRSRPV